MWSILMIALFQMPSVGITPAINKMYTEIFTDKPLATVQTVVSITGIMGPIVSLSWAFLIRRDFATKRFSVLFGVTSLSLAGLLAICIHNRLWHIAILSVLLGFGAASYVPNTTSILVDNFEGEIRRKITGRQTIFASLGGIFFCIIGGYIVNFRWFGGYLLFLLMIPVAIYSFFVIPKYRSGSRTEQKPQKSKLNPDVFYYVVCQFFLYFLYLVFANNISVHFAQSGTANYSVAAGYATAVAMLGSFTASNLFKKLSPIFGDMLISMAYFAIFIGYSILNLFDHSLPMIFVGVFITGLAMGTVPPQSILSTSKRVDESTSALAMALITAFASGIGSFFSPIVFTNLTTAIGGESTSFRYQFVAFVALTLSVIVFFLTKYRAKKQAGLYD